MSIDMTDRKAQQLLLAYSSNVKFTLYQGSYSNAWIKNKDLLGLEVPK